MHTISKDVSVIWNVRSIYIYIYIVDRGVMRNVVVNIYLYIYVCVCVCVWCHPQTDSFVVSQLFSVARHAGRFKLGLKPAQLYVRLSIIPLSQQSARQLGNYKALCSSFRLTYPLRVNIFRRINKDLMIRFSIYFSWFNIF